MATDPNIHPYWAAETKELAAKLDSMDYFEVLGVERDATLQQIKDKYHDLQRAYHPDTFYQSPDDDLKKSVFKIAKRLSEAYVVLREPHRREQYAKDIAGRQRDKKLRFNEESEKSARDEQQAIHGKTTQGRKLIQKALRAIEDGDLKSAENDLKTALLFESGNKPLKARLKALRKQMKGG